MANKSYIELPKFFASNLINDETEYSTIIIEEGLEEVDGKQIGFITAPITFNLNDTFTQERLPGASGFNATGEWNLFTQTNRETPVLTKTCSFVQVAGPLDTSFRINTDGLLGIDDGIEEPGMYFVTFTLKIPETQMFSFLPPAPAVEEVYGFEFLMEPDFPDVMR